MNYSPRSHQYVPIHSHDYVIQELSRRNPDIHFLIAKASDELKAYVSNNSVQNIFDCVEFDCEETKSCENICRLNHIMHECDYVVVFDIGACFTYSDDKMLDYGHTILHVAHAPQFYDYIAGSFPREAFEAKVRFVNAYNQDQVIHLVEDIIQKKENPQ
jgi:hypothetical protein